MTTSAFVDAITALTWSTTFATAASLPVDLADSLRIALSVSALLKSIGALAVVISLAIDAAAALAASAFFTVVLAPATAAAVCVSTLATSAEAL
ncbi:MAG: hypothetical protein EBS54_08820 [Betaproteobacteria bacterium]|nr:hypothetical protein [Betaproteobacteria bacterium]